MRESLKCLLQCHIIVSTYILSNIIFNFKNLQNEKYYYFLYYLVFFELLYWPFKFLWLVSLSICLFFLLNFFFCLLYQLFTNKFAHIFLCFLTLHSGKHYSLQAFPFPFNFTDSCGLLKVRGI